jgi:hypothetical protein
MHPRRAAPRLLLLFVSLVVAPAAGCVPQPVAWEEERALPAAAVAAPIALDGAGRVAAAPPGASPAAPPAGDAACPNSLQVAAAAGQERYAVWWAPRADSTARLLAAHSGDGGVTWPDAYVVDSLDRGARGCRRPPPAIAADARNGYVHVTYALDAPEGAGIFYAHLMDPRAQFELPVPIVYGEGSGATAVASDDQTLAVAYENPNSRRAQVALAVSLTAGHTFEGKSVTVSGDDAEGASPRVAVRGRRVAVAWVGEGGAPRVRTGAVK